jgi:hypothetical protein
MPRGRLPDRDGGGAENGARPVRNPLHAERDGAGRASKASRDASPAQAR